MDQRQASVAATVFSCLGAPSILLGSLVIIAAPNDGQTGMVAFPLWAFGAAMGLIATALAIWSTVRTRWLVAGLALVSLISIVLAWRAG
jgi:hypothetical protein